MTEARIAVSEVMNVEAPSEGIEPTRSEELEERTSPANDKTSSERIETYPADELEERNSPTPNQAAKPVEPIPEETTAPSDLELTEEQAQQMVTFQNRIAELENKLEGLKADDARRAEEVEQMRISNETRLHALENKVAEIQSRVLLLQASLVSSGAIIQRKQRA